MLEYENEDKEDDVAGTTVTVVDVLLDTELEDDTALALLETPHCGLYWYWPVPSTMSSTA